MRRRHFLGAASMSLAAAGCSEPPIVNVIRYKLTAGIQIGGQAFSGSSVIENKCSQPVPGQRHFWEFYTVETHAEAVVIDLGRDGLLFGLIANPSFIAGYAARWPDDYLLDFLSGEARSRSLDNSVWRWQQYESLAGVFELPPAFPVILVRYKNIEDPMSAELVSPQTISGIYGRPAAIAPATITIPVSNALTTGIERRLPWYSRGGYYLDRQPPHPFRSVFSDQLPGYCFKADGRD